MYTVDSRSAVVCRTNNDFLDDTKTAATAMQMSILGMRNPPHRFPEIRHNNIVYGVHAVAVLPINH